MTLTDMETCVPRVAEAFDGYPAEIRTALVDLRRLILETAAETDGVGELVETLKWGQPSYLPATANTGTTVRIDALKDGSGTAVYVHCQTSLVPEFRELYDDRLAFEGNRAIVLKNGAEVPREELKHCIALALTYHLRNRKKAR